MTVLLRTKPQVRAAVAAERAQGRTVGLVPTMGALHEGHLSLVRAARELCDAVVVSIFVNPTQFAPGEDFERYPRDLDADIELLVPHGADLVFAPSAEEMYGAGLDVSVLPGAIAEKWEGAIRPGHFEGVATVVTKLLGVVRPDLAFFGEKDYQQLLVVKSLAEGLDLGVQVVGCPIVRDADGLALSSRNAYLSADDRARARAIPRALEAAADAASAGEGDATVLAAGMRRTLEDAGLEIDYAAVVDPETLDEVDAVGPGARAIVAARVGATRLIDNRELALGAPASQD